MQATAGSQGLEPLRPLERGLSASSGAPPPVQSPQQQQQQHNAHTSKSSHAQAQQSSNAGSELAAAQEPSSSVEKLLSPVRPAAIHKADSGGFASPRRASLLQQTSAPVSALRSSNATPKKTRFGNDDTTSEAGKSGRGNQGSQDRASMEVQAADGIKPIPAGGPSPRPARAGLSSSKSGVVAQGVLQAASGPPLFGSAGSFALPAVDSSSPIATRQTTKKGPDGAAGMMKEGELIAPPSRRHLDPRLLCISSLPVPPGSAAPQPLAADPGISQPSPELLFQVQTALLH